MAVEELRRKLGVPDGSFKNFAEFRRDVLAKSKSEIDQLADFTVDWEEVRGAGRGRPVIAVKLSFNPKDMVDRSEEHTSELQSVMRISYAVFCLKKKKNKYNTK